MALYDIPKDRVVFLKDCEHSGEIVAVFPDQIYPDGTICCYAHIGQHSVCSRRWARVRWRVTATADETYPLYAELESIGYNLEICGKSAIPKAG